ncbi:MAG: class I SAM-dependent methyltransferase [Solirubrobacteraceae bacterium]
MEPISPANEEAIRAWNGPLFDRFVQFREVVTTGLGAHGDAALAIYPPQAGERVLDVGCGFGDASQRLADLVGPGGAVVGVDVAERFIETAQEEAADAGVQNLRFEVRDVELTDFDGQRFDYAFSRFGTMFFANPVAALRNVRRALRPGGRLCMAVWRRKLDNDWMHCAENVVKAMVEKPEESDEPTCGPGPFSMADADTTSEIVQIAGFEDVAFHRHDIPIRIGRDLDEAVAFVMALGPAGEVLRLAGADAEHLLPDVIAALRDALAQFDGPDGIRAPASTWTIAARAPA